MFVCVFQDFYSYACGGYNEKSYLSWFSTRVRENPEEIIHHYRQYAIGEFNIDIHLLSYSTTIIILLFSISVHENKYPERAKDQAR